MGGLTIHRPGQDVPPGSLVADRPLCVDRSQSKLVEDGSVESAFLLAAKGDTIPTAVVKRLGLVVVGGRVVQASAAPEPEVAVAPAHVRPPDSGELLSKGEPIMPPESKRSRKK